MRKCVKAMLIFSNGDYDELSRGSGLSLDDIHEFVNKKYRPAEPLIKDERVRKAVRAWAEAIYKGTIKFDRVSQGFSFGNGIVFSSINFDGFVFDLVDGKKYTIAELCGEEEE